MKNDLIGIRKAILDANYNNLYNSNFIGLNTVMIHRKLVKRIIFPNLKTKRILLYGLIG